ncbi:hypothetical protein MRB53_035657 [Persea americana]|uniref:Uncharacterized protein n=1 Tax=Persea americana TaxID=3435 RepID=A0ACC2K589_PERAE|nr:hypothetical protein MRB53_035657 [Persea americana]
MSFVIIDIDCPTPYKRATRPFYHLDEVAGAALADVGDARAVDQRGDLLEYVLDIAVGVEGVAEHEGGAAAAPSSPLKTPMPR